jgi:hypothetical protein
MLDRTRQVTAEVLAVVARARELGVRFTVATGRVFCSAIQVAAELGIDEPIISDGGAVIRHPDGRPPLLELRIEPAMAARILSATAAEDADQHVFFEDEILVSRVSAAVQRYAGRLRIEMKPVPDLAAAARQKARGPTMIVLRSTPENAPLLRARYAAMFGDRVQVTSTAPHFVDFLHHSAGKAAALAQLCRSLGIRREEVIAVGDGINDLDMLAYAGVGALVANARPHLWKYADYVASLPHCSGVAEVIERFCLK